MVVFRESKKTKDSRGNDITFSQCQDWDSGNVDSCKNNAPGDTKGWIRCALGSDPTSVFCSPYTPGEFSCVFAQECYSVSNFGDPTKFSNPTEPSCEGAGNKISFSKCTDWFNNDPVSCYTSANKPEGIVGWMTCALGSEPTNSSGLGCSPITSNSESLNCIVGQDCYAITRFEADDTCKKTGITAVPELIASTVPNAIGKFAGNLVGSAFKAGNDKNPISVEFIAILVIILLIILSLAFVF
jgi:hypothetical protein